MSSSRLQRSPSDPLEIYAVGKQWMWKIQHESGKREINTLHRAQGPARPPDHDLGGRNPRFFHSGLPRQKRRVARALHNSVVRGHADGASSTVFCAEYCGTQHSGMIGKVIVLEPADYHDWLMGASSGESMVEAGERQFQQLGCETCHKSTATGRGPSLVGIYDKPVILSNGQEVVVDSDYIRESILQPQAKIVAGYEPIMPIFEGQISEQSLLQNRILYRIPE